ncbi:MAG: hypothetical protein ACFBZ8_02210 [Opitutales bacterium]
MTQQTRLALCALCFFTPAVVTPASETAPTAPFKQQPFVHAAGDVYQLRVTETRTSATTAEGGIHESRIEKEILTEYAATVEILEVDVDGQPVRENHTEVTLVVTSDGKRMTANPREGALSFERSGRKKTRTQIRSEGRRIEEPFRSILTSVAPMYPQSYSNAALLEATQNSGEFWQADAKALSFRLETTYGIELVSRELPGTFRTETTGSATRWSFSTDLQRLRAELPDNVHASRTGGTFSGEASWTPGFEGGTFTLDTVLAYEFSGGTNRYGVARNEAKWRTEARIERQEQRIYAAPAVVAAYIDP